MPSLSKNTTWPGIPDTYMHLPALGQPLLIGFNGHEAVLLDP